MDTKPLENKITDFTVELAVRNNEVEDLRKQVKSFELLKHAIGAPRDVVNKARLFDEDVKTEGEISAAKIIKVLVSFTRKVETALGEICKIVFGTATGESSRPPRPRPTDTPHKEKPLSEVRTPPPQRPEKEAIAETSGATPTTEFMVAKPVDAMAVPVVTPIPKGRRSVSAEPSPRKGKKKKESSLEYEELEGTLEEARSSSEGTGFEQVTLPLETERRVNTRSSDRKRPLLECKTSATSKKHQKSPGKGGSLQKKPQGK